MTTSKVWTAALAAVALSIPLVFGPGPARAEVPQDAGTILFETPQFQSAAAGSTVKYSYSRKTKDAERLRPSFDDVIELKLDAGAKPEERNVTVVLFKGPMHRAAGPFDGVDWNPVTVLALEYHLSDMAKILGANPRYLKNTIRAALRDRAVIEPVKLQVGGREVEGRKISIKPFEKDAHQDQLRVFAGLAYEFTVSDAVPGSVFEIRIAAPDPTGGAPVWEEVTRYVEN